MPKGKSNGSRRRAAASETDLSRFQEGGWDLPRCFIIHAWSPPAIRLVISQIKTTLKDNFHVIVDLDFGAGESIRKQALEGIRDAALVVAIMDDLRPNVVFELGYALALKKPCIPLVRKGAVVNVRDYFPEDQREGVENPALDIDAHFSDLKDLKWCHYDHEDPASPGAVIKKELDNKGADGRSLGRRALETWVAVLRRAYEPKGKCFDELYEYILKSTVTLGKPLFATRRKTRFNELLTKGAVCRAKKTPGKAKPVPLPDAVIEAAADLPHEARLDLLQTLLWSYPNDQRLHFSECYTVAMLAKETGYKDAPRCGEALRLHEEFLDKWPEDADAHNNYANLLKDLNCREEAEAHYREALRIRPEDAEVHYNYANLLSDLNRPKEAEEHYREALRISPEIAEAHNNYANLLKDLNRPEEAEAHYREALRIRPEFAEAHNNYAILLSDLKRHEEAEEHYREALRITPDYAEAHYNYAILLKNLNRPKEAEAHFREALRIRPEYAEAHNNYAVLLKTLNRRGEAEEHYREALRIRPEDAKAHNNYANLLKDLNRPEEAEEHYREALRIRPDYAEAWANLGLLFQDLGRTVEARKAYERALALADRLPDGGGDRVRKWLDQLGDDEGTPAPGTKG